MSVQSRDDYIRLQRERPHLFEQGEIKIITDPVILEKYEQDNQRELGVIYHSPYHLLVNDLVQVKNQVLVYERMIKTNEGNSIVIIPKYLDTYILVKQFRHAMRKDQWCFPRGFGENGLSIEENAAKEVEEELGCSMVSCDILGQVVADSGICGEKVHICLCEITEPTLVLTEGISSIELVSEQELQQLMKQKKIEDSFTIAAWFWHQLYRN